MLSGLLGDRRWDGVCFYVFCFFSVLLFDIVLGGSVGTGFCLSVLALECVFVFLGCFFFCVFVFGRSLLGWGWFGYFLCFLFSGEGNQRG